MCGISGFIGSSTFPALSYNLATELFNIVEARGRDASGVYATEEGKNGSIYYHKDATTSSKFIKEEYWKSLEKEKIDLMICHARGTSPGIGGASNNKNNHPFISSDSSLALIHNGRIHEYDNLKEKYETHTDCDSEILLRILQAPDEESLNINKEIPKNHESIIKGFRDIWSQIDYGHFAISVARRHDDGTRTLYFCRNQHRPIWIADLRNSLGQLFFCSTDDMFRECLSYFNYFSDISVPLIELPVQEIWSITTNNKGEILDENIFRAKVISKETSKWEYKGVKKPIVKEESKIKRITQLDDKDCVIKKENKVNNTTINNNTTLTNNTHQGQYQQHNQYPHYNNSNNYVQNKGHIPFDTNKNTVNNGHGSSLTVVKKDNEEIDTVTVSDEELDNLIKGTNDDLSMVGLAQLEDLSDISDVLNKIERVINNISTNIELKVEENSITKSDIEQIFENLNSILQDAKTADSMI